MNKIFLDNNSTTQLDPIILDKMIPFFIDKYGNPSSKTHSFGWEAEAHIEKSRSKIANIINAEPNEIIFTSGATESNNLAILGLMNQNKISNMITMSSEHKAILDICEHLKKKGKDIIYIKPKQDGLINLNDLQNKITQKTKLISIMHANNEIGVIQPIQKIGEICKNKKIFFHVDGAQSLGKVTINVKQMNIDLLSLSSHKIYGPKGIGCLYINKKIQNLEPLFFGGSQEKKIRPGTLPVPLIVGFGEACQLINEKFDDENSKILTLRNLLIDKLKSKVPDLIINGDIVDRIPGNINCSFPSLKGKSILPKMINIAVSSGSACTSSSPKPSHVLKSIGLNNQLINSSLRLCIGRFNTIDEINVAAKTIIKAVNYK